MKVSRVDKKQEAIKRMEVLGLFRPCIKAFQKDDEVQLTEPSGGIYEFNYDDELNARIEEFEDQHNALVYHVIHTYAQFGELFNFLYISDYREEWEMDNYGIKDGYVMAYVWNKSDDYMSEIGEIAVRKLFGGLVRIG
jgi:hypothetical protein